MSEVVPFAFEGVEVRTLIADDEVHWIATDVATILGYRMASDATRWLDDDEKGTHPLRTPGGLQSLATVNEAGLYTLIMRSKSDLAKSFRRWVTHEVLPTLRQTGRYETPAASALDAAEVEARLRLLGAARRAGGLTVDEVRVATWALLDPLGLVHPDWQPLPTPKSPAGDVMAWIRRRKFGAGDTFSVREAYQSLDGRRWCRRVVDLEPVLDELVADGHLRAVPRPAERLRGRPPSPRFEVLTVGRRLAAVPDGGTGAAS